jgi:hypothetical protein
MNTAVLVGANINLSHLNRASLDEQHFNSAFI